MSARDEHESTIDFLRVSTSSEDSISRIDLAEVTDFGDFRSAVLSACKHQILRPYIRLLAVVGLKNFGSDAPRFGTTMGRLQLALVTAFTIFGHTLQYLVCFRRDRGLSCGSEKFGSFQNSTFGLIIPSALHFLGYAYILYLFRYKETERLENLMEKTFLLSAHRANGRKAHLVKRLWMFIFAGMVWVIVSLSTVSFFVAKADLEVFEWLRPNPRKSVVKVLLVSSMLWQDMIQATVITSFCLQAQLLSFSLYFLREKLLQHTIHPLSWIREVNECQSVLFYLNRDFSPGVCLYIFLNASWIISCAFRFSMDDHVEETTLTIVAICLWAVAALAPFALAANLTSACTSLRRSGHEVRIRPFVYQDTPGEDLDSILLYTSTLKMKSKLFGVSVKGSYLCFLLTLISVSVLVTGQSHLF